MSEPEGMEGMSEKMANALGLPVGCHMVGVEPRVGGALIRFQRDLGGPVGEQWADLRRVLSLPEEDRASFLPVETVDLRAPPTDAEVCAALADLEALSDDDIHARAARSAGEASRRELAATASPPEYVPTYEEIAVDAIVRLGLGYLEGLAVEQIAMASNASVPWIRVKALRRAAASLQRAAAEIDKVAQAEAARAF